MSDSQKADNWKSKFGVTYTAEFAGHFHHWHEDKDTRDVYRCTLERNGRKFVVRFGQSLALSAL